MICSSPVGRGQGSRHGVPVPTRAWPPTREHTRDAPRTEGNAANTKATERPRGSRRRGRAGRGLTSGGTRRPIIATLEGCSRSRAQRGPGPGESLCLHRGPSLSSDPRHPRGHTPDPARRPPRLQTPRKPGRPVPHRDSRPMLPAVGTPTPLGSTRRRAGRTRKPRYPEGAEREPALRSGGSHSGGGHPSAANENRTCPRRWREEGTSRPEAAFRLHSAASRLEGTRRRQRSAARGWQVVALEALTLDESIQQRPGRSGHLAAVSGPAPRSLVLVK